MTKSKKAQMQAYVPFVSIMGLIYPLISHLSLYLHRPFQIFSKFGFWKGHPFLHFSLV
jgi:hypothetical protein